MVKSLHDAFSYIPIFGMREGSNGIVHLLVAWRIRSMTIAFQLAVFALIATSSILLISVPVYLLLLKVGQVTKMLYFPVQHYGLD
ncbi:TPA_asm: hypothetical protein HUJ06_000074 [Nelumbo nucifera]|uniref:Uncharacterized protein n=1 Tax=Nelumbo nucifera TaxID=4432 RepID=A0A822ZWS5_NELNU|nr:TPA_asm: hypothetical protein HUJ06_000074 [Nelumbo nucifera]